ncbi:MAG: spore germination protein [Christensenellales bacterium]
MNSYVEKLKKDLSYKESFDVTFREIRTKYHHYTIIFKFFNKSEGIINIIYSLDHFSSYEGVEQISKIILNESTTTENNYYLIYDAILSGNVAIFVDDDTNAILSEVRNYPTRGIEEPDGEKVVRGSRDGFTENIATNIGLIRRKSKKWQT